MGYQVIVPRVSDPGPGTPGLSIVTTMFYSYMGSLAKYFG